MPAYKDYRTEYGVIHYGPCTDDLPNIEAYAQGEGHTVIVLQRAAMRAFKAAQRRYAKASGWTAARLRRNPNGRPIYVLAGSYRTCARQAQLHREDPVRFADEAVSGHPRGIALDIDRSQSNIAKVDAALRSVGWTWARSDEPWHVSWGVTV